MTDDDAIKTVARALREADGASGTWAEISYRSFANVFLGLGKRIGLTPADLAGLADGARVVVPVDLLWRLDDTLAFYEAPVEYDLTSFSGHDGKIVVPDFYDELGFGDMASNTREMIPAGIREAISRWLDNALSARPGAHEKKDASKCE